MSVTTTARERIRSYAGRSPITTTTRRRTTRSAATPASPRITMLVKGNPKRPGSSSYDRFELLRRSKTVEDYRRAVLATGGTETSVRRDLAWDSAHGFIQITDK